MPPIRDFIIGQILYQGDFFFPVQRHATVVRWVHPTAGARPAPVEVPVRQGSVNVGELVSATLHGERRHYRVYLPPGYSDPANRMRRYPTLYLLHGWPGDSSSWLRGAHPDYATDEGIATGQVQPMIIVMPDLSGDMWRDTECVNKWDGSDNEMSYFVGDVVPFIDGHYRTLPDRGHRALGGISAGGYCAFNIGLHYPGTFGTLFSISGYFHARRGEVFGLNNPFGSNARFLAANSPDDYIATVPAARSMHLFIVDGTADSSYTSYARAFDRKLIRLGIRHVLIMRHDSATILGDHTWAFWRSAFRMILPALSRCFGRPYAL